MSYESNHYYKSGSWNVHCDVCGFKFKATDIKKRWDGLMVCKDDWEPDHPQKYIRVTEDIQVVPFVRHQADNTFTYVCYIYASMAYADLAEADCARADNTTISYDYALELKGT